MSLILSGKAKRGNQEVSFLEILLQWANNYSKFETEWVWHVFWNLRIHMHAKSVKCSPNN